MKDLFWNKSEKRMVAGIRIVLFIVIASLLSIPASLVIDGFSPFFQKTFTNFLVMLCILLAIKLMGVYADKREWAAFGITLKPFPQFLDGTFVGAILISCIFLQLHFFGLIQLEDTLVSQFQAVPFLIVLGGQIFRYFCGSVFEEAFTRSYLLKNIAEGMNGIFSAKFAVIVSYLVTSSLFALLHLFNDSASLLSIINLILFGLLLGWRVIITGKLHFAIGLHASWNIFQNLIYGFNNSGKPSQATIFKYQDLGYEFWTGGQFGLEGGFACTCVLFLYFGFYLIRTFMNGKFNQRIV